jgi:hypothetical protein
MLLLIKGPNVPRKAVLLELGNVIEDVNRWLSSPFVDNLLINSVDGVLVRDACLEREACLTDVESDLMKYDEHWKRFISKVAQSESSPDEIVIKNDHNYRLKLISLYQTSSFGALGGKLALTIMNSN